MASRLRLFRYLKFSHSRRFYARDPETDLSNMFVGGGAPIPTGKSDMAMHSRVSLLSQDMEEEQKMMITGISNQGFRLVDGTFLYGPIAIFPKTVLSWRVVRPTDITPESLEFFFLLQPKLDIIVLGVGDKKDLDSVRKQVVKSLTGRKIGVEILPTEDAIPLFNTLSSESRYVGAALYPPRNLVVTDDQFDETLKQFRAWDQLDESPIVAAFSFVPNEGIDNIIEKIWGKPRPDIRANLDEIRALNQLATRQESEEYRITKELMQKSKKPKSIPSQDDPIPLRIKDK